MADPNEQFAGFTLATLTDGLGDLLQQTGALAALNSKLKTAVSKDSIGPLTVVDHTGNTLTLQLRGTYPLLGQSAFVRSRFECQDQVSLPLSTGILGFKLLSFMAEIKVKKDPLYECALGYGFDVGDATRPRYSVGRGMIDLVGPGLRFDVFLGGISDQGFALALTAGGSSSEKANRFPVIIPLGASGLGITGIGGSFAHNFEPRLNPVTNPPNPTAHDYVSWAQRANGDELDIWEPASKDGGYRGGLGINCDLVTLDGFLLRFRKVGFAYLSYGPVILFGGSGIFLQSEICSVDAMGAIDFASGSFDVSAGAKVLIPPGSDWRIIEASGAMEVFLSNHSPSSCYFNLGTNKDPIHGSFLKGLAYGGVFFMLNTQRVMTGGYLGFSFKLDWGPFKLDLYYALGGYALLGWNPVQIGAALDLSGGVRACAFGLCLGIELAGNMAVAVPKPVRYALALTLRLELSWPLPTITWSGTVFNFNTDDPPDLDAPILLGFVPADPTSATPPDATPSASLGAVHARTGRQWKLDGDSAPARIWPDSDLVVPFSRKVMDSANIVMGPKVDPIKEGGFEVHHELKSLQVVKIIDQSGTEIQTPVDGLRALWVAGPEGDISRLHVPCEDPFAWLFHYSTTYQAAQTSPPVLIEQDFGGGVAEYNILSTRSFGNVAILPTAPVDLSYLPTSQDHTRFLSGAEFKIQLQTPGSGDPIVIDKLLLTIATSDSTLNDWNLDTGFVAGSLQDVSELGGGVWLRSVTISRSDGKPFSSIRLSARTHVPCSNEGSEETTCYRRLLVNRVRFLETPTSQVDWKQRTVLKPGIYRLKINGQSIAYGYNKQSPPLIWKPYVSPRFQVIYPETIRPYVRYTTLGDSRVFGEMPNSWNPTPLGRGFPTYIDDLAIVRFNAPCISDIFEKLSVEVINSHHVSKILPDAPYRANLDGESALSGKSLAWRKQNSGSAPPDQELQLDNRNDPWVRGVGHVRFHYLDTVQTPPVNVLLDEWNFDISRFQSASDHLKLPTPSITKLYTMAGPKETQKSYSWPSSPLPTTPPTVPDAPPPDWPIPKALADLASEDLNSDKAPSAGLRFLHFARRLGTRFGAGNDDQIVGLIEPSDMTVLEAPVDHINRPYALLLRTSEPFEWGRIRLRSPNDWSRIGVDVLAYAIDLPPSGDIVFQQIAPIALIARVIPNFDGTQAFLVAYVGDVAVRWPRAAFELRFTYKRKVDRLPTLRSNVEGSRDAVITHRVIYPTGTDWPIRVPFVR